MQYKDLDELYQTRRVPWIPIVIGACLALLLILFLTRSKTVKPAAGDAASALSAEATEARAAPAGSEAAASAATSPEAAKASPYPADELDKTEAEARALQQRDKLIEARDLLLGLLEDGRALGNRRRGVEQRLGEISIELVVSQRPMPGKTAYFIKPGDSLSKIAARFNCPAELIQKANKIANPALIRPNNRLVVLNRPEFAILVDKRDNTLLLTLGGRFLKRYRVGTGKFDSTPEGGFIVSDKIIEPPWWHPDGKVIPFGDPENILGTRWLALEASGETAPVSGYGIHGTWEDSSIGTASSAGCVRMINKEVEELFMLVPRGTPVTIR